MDKVFVGGVITNCSTDTCLSTNDISGDLQVAYPPSIVSAPMGGLWCLSSNDLIG